jgi:3-oxoacyl-[acyl-carrier protein] reductase
MPGAGMPGAVTRGGVAAARTAAEIGQTVKSIRRTGGTALAVRTDICVERDVKALFAAVCRRFRRLDILVNNAGLGIYGPLAEFDARDFDKVLAVSARGTFLCCREALKPMVKARRGYIINIASVLGFRGYANQSAYTAAKHAVMGLTKSLAVEAQPHGIRVSAILPGGVDTAMARKSRPDLDPSSLLSPEDIAAIGVAEGDSVSVLRKVTWTEKFMKLTKGTGKAGADMGADVSLVGVSPSGSTPTAPTSVNVNLYNAVVR